MLDRSDRALSAQLYVIACSQLQLIGASAIVDYAIGHKPYSDAVAQRANRPYKGQSQRTRGLADNESESENRSRENCVPYSHAVLPVQDAQDLHIKAFGTSDP